MKIKDVLDDFYNGKKIKRKSSRHSYNLIYLDKNSDMLAEDWEVIEEPDKTFQEVFEAFKNGKYIRRKSWEDYELFHREYLECGVNLIIAEDLLASDWVIL